MRHPVVMIFALLSPTALLPHVLAQQSGPVIIESDARAFPRVSATFELRLPSGELAAAIPANEVTVLEGNQVSAGRIEQVGARDGAAYAFTVDTSGTMRKVVDPLKAGVTSLVQGMGVKDRASLMVFDDDVRTLIPFTADKDAFSTGLNGLKAEGRTTQLYLGALRAIESLSAPGLPSRKLVVVVSDGQDEGTAYTLDDVIAAAKKSGVSLVCLGLTGGDSRFLLNLQRMAEQTGGLFLRVEPGADWAAKTQLVARHVSSRFRFEWDSTLPMDGASHEVRLEIKGEGGSVGANISVVTPSEVWWKRRPFIVGASAAALVLLVAGWLLWRHRRAERARVEALEKELSKEREQRADVEKNLGEGLEKVSEKIGELGKTPHAPTTSGPAAPPPAKRRTVFMAGHASAPVTYRAAYLEVLNGPIAGARLPLPAGRTPIGRDETNAIVVLDEKASSSHAAISSEGGTYRLEDVGSTNGTFVGEARLSTSCVLREGDPIRIGGTQFRFRGEA